MNYYSHKYFTALCFGDNLEIIDSCTLPDEDETKNDYSCHFYNPVTQKCFRGTEDSAKNRFIWHLSNYLIDNKSESLGRAIHYLEDICTPVHSQYEDFFDAAIRLKLHIDFEKQFDEFLENNDLTAIKGRYYFDSINEIISFCSCESSKLYYDYRDYKEHERVFEKVFVYTRSAIYSLKEILKDHKAIAKTITLNGEKINVVIEKGRMSPACLNTNYCLRFNGIDNVAIFYCDNHLFNYKNIGDLF